MLHCPSAWLALISSGQQAASETTPKVSAEGRREDPRSGPSETAGPLRAPNAWAPRVCADGGRLGPQTRRESIGTLLISDIRPRRSPAAPPRLTCHHQKARAVRVEKPRRRRLNRGKLLLFAGLESPFPPQHGLLLPPRFPRCGTPMPPRSRRGPSSQRAPRPAHSQRVKRLSELPHATLGIPC